MLSKNAFAFGRSDFGNHLVVPLKRALHHHYLLAWMTIQHNTDYVYNHWLGERAECLATFLDTLVEDTTLKPAGRIKVYLETIERIKCKAEALQDNVKDHYLDIFEDQTEILKKNLPQKVATDFWTLVQKRSKKRLITAKLTGRRWTFEKVFGPTDQ